MRRRIVRVPLVLTVAAAALTGCAGPPDVAPTTASATAASTTASATASPGSMLALQLPGMADVAPATEEYVAADGTRLGVDVYLPPGAVEPPPLVLLLHGVTPDADPKSFGAFVGWGQALATSGVAAAVINYRPDDTGADTHGSADVAAALTHVRAHAARLGVDGGRVGVLAFSAGAPFGVATAFAAASQPIAALGVLYGPIEPADPAASAYSLSTGLAARPDLPVFLGYGARDTVPGVAESLARFTASPVADRPTVTLQTHETAGHAFDFRARDDRSRQIVQAALDFFAAALAAR